MPEQPEQPDQPEKKPEKKEPWRESLKAFESADANAAEPELRAKLEAVFQHSQAANIADTCDAALSIQTEKINKLLPPAIVSLKLIPVDNVWALRVGAATEEELLMELIVQYAQNEAHRRRKRLELKLQLNEKLEKEIKSEGRVLLKALLDTGSEGNFVIKKRLASFLEVISVVYSISKSIEMDWLTALLSKASTVSELQKMKYSDLHVILKDATAQEAKAVVQLYTRGNSLREAVVQSNTNLHIIDVLADSGLHRDLATFDEDKLNELYEAATEDNKKWLRPALKRLYHYMTDKEDRLELDRQKDQMKKLTEAREEMNKAQAELEKGARAANAETKQAAAAAFQASARKVDALLGSVKKASELPSDWKSVLSNGSKLLEDLGGIINDRVTLATATPLSHLDIVNSASAGRARTGVFLREPKKNPPKILLKPFEYVEWLGVSTARKENVFVSFESNATSDFSSSVVASGYTAAVSATFSGWGAKGSLSVGKSKRSESDRKSSTQRKSESLTNIMCVFDPVKAFALRRHDMHLSADARKLAKELEDADNSKAEKLSVEFLDFFGDHINESFQVLGGIMFASTEISLSEQQETSILKEAAASEISVEGSAGYSGFGVSASVSAKYSSFTASSSTNADSSASMQKTTVTQFVTYGPPAKSPSEFSSNLRAHNSTWQIIDRGDTSRTCIGIWELLKSEGFEKAAKRVHDTYGHITMRFKGPNWNALRNSVMPRPQPQPGPRPPIPELLLPPGVDEFNNYVTQITNRAAAATKPYLKTMFLDEVLDMASEWQSQILGSNEDSQTILSFGNVLLGQKYLSYGNVLLEHEGFMSLTAELCAASGTSDFEVTELAKAREQIVSVFGTENGRKAVYETALGKAFQPMLRTVIPPVDVGPVVDPVAPVVDPVAPVVDPVAPVVNPVAPVVNPVAPVVNPVAPVVNPVFNPVIVNGGLVQPPG